MTAPVGQSELQIVNHCAVKEQSEIERLDLAARAESITVDISGARLPLTILSIFFVLLAIISGASFDETLAVRVLAVLAVVTTILLWRASRFASYGVAVFCFVILVGSWLPFDNPDAHTLLGLTARAVVSTMILLVGYRWWTNGMPFIAAHAEGLAEERAKVAAWLKALKSINESNQFVEFSTQSFLQGYWTYRLLNTGSCWAIAKSKTRKMDRLLGFRVLALDAVHVTELPTGKMRVEMANFPIQDVEISNEMRDRLLQLADANR